MACRTDTLPHFLTDVADAIRAKAGTSGTIQASTFDTAIANIPSGTTEPAEKDVNFYDTDGTRIYSYTKTEFLALTSMPDVPTKDGLTSQGWNWSLSGAKEYVTDYNELDIGALYVTSDGKTKIYITLKEWLSPTLAFRIDTTNGSVTIDWGDNNTQTVTDDGSIHYAINHTYSSAGDYVITLENTGTLGLGLTDSATLFLLSNSTITETDPLTVTGGKLDYYYANCVKKIEFGGSQNNPISIDLLAFNYLNSLKEVVLNNYSTIADVNAMFNNSGLETIILNDTSILNVANTGNLKRIILPENYNGNLKLTGSNISRISIPKNAVFQTSSFNNNYYIEHFYIPSTITTIPATCFGNCKAKYYDFSKHTSVPTLSNKTGFTTAAFEGVQIRVPSSLVDSWKSANNWSNFASYIVGV